MTTYPSPFAPSPPPQPKRRTTTTFWAVLVFGGLVACSALILVFAVTRGQFPRLGSGPSWTPPPLAAPAPAAVGGAERSAERPFLINDLVQNASGGRVNLRQTPGYQNKPPEDVIAVIPPGEAGAVVDGPQDADGLRWWRVRFAAGEGWIAERSNSGKVLLDLVQP